MVLYCIVLYCIVLYCFVLYCILLYCIVYYYIVLYCFVLYCIVLSCSSSGYNKKEMNDITVLMTSGTSFLEPKRPISNYSDSYVVFGVPAKDASLTIAHYTFI